MARPFTTHQRLEQQDPHEEEMARAYEQNRRARHLQCGGTEASYVAARAFPCLGVMQVVDYGDIWTLCCDRCRYETTIRSPEREPEHQTAAADW